MSKFKLYTDEEIETLKKLYKDHFDYEIAEILDRPTKSINAKINQLGLKDRIPPTKLLKLRKWAQLEEKYKMPIDELLYKLHWVDELPLRNGMDHALETNPHSVTCWMKELEVPHRSISEDNKRRYSTMTEEQIKAQTKAANEHIRKYGNPHQIGRQGWSAGLTKETHPGLKISSEKHMGENNPMWNKRREEHPTWSGKDKYWKYKDWFEIRDQIKKRDEYKCQKCGINEEESYNIFGQPLQVHHIIPYRECKEHSPENLITLCASCHRKEDGNLVGGHKRRQKKSQISNDVNQTQFTISQF